MGRAYCLHACELTFCVELWAQVKVWVKELRKMLGNEITLCIAGNKVDLEKERHVTVEEAETYGLRYAIIFCVTVRCGPTKCQNPPYTQKPQAKCWNPTLKLKLKSVARSKSWLNIEMDFSLNFSLDFDISAVDFCPSQKYRNPSWRLRWYLCWYSARISYVQLIWTLILTWISFFCHLILCIKCISIFIQTLFVAVYVAVVVWRLFLFAGMILLLQSN